jgi:micrococcal nuclease
MSLYSYPCKILRVVDGDTIDVELDLGFNIKMKERVRLLGVDTPEVYGRYSTPEGAVATEFVTNWLVERANKYGSFSYVSRKYDAKDKYGRSLGLIIWTSGDGTVMEDLNEAIVLSGNVK